MNYLWEILIQAKKQGIEEKRIRFLPARSYSPYMELSETFLNTTELEEPYEVQINPCYRFQDIFGRMFHPDRQEYMGMKESLFQLIMHQLGENDIRAGMTREEYYKKLLARMYEEKEQGEVMTSAFSNFRDKEREILLEGILTLYREGESLKLFEYIMKALIPVSIVYENNDRPLEILIFIGKKRTENLVQKVGFLTEHFLGIKYHAEIYYEYHFGIIGMEETMSVGEIAIY